MTENLKSCKKSILLVLALTGVGSLLLAPSVIAAPPATGGFASGRILMAPRAGLPEHALQRILENANGQAAERIGSLNVRVVQVPPGLERQAVERLRNNPHVEFAELDNESVADQATPNDPYFSNAWHLSKIGATSAWATATGEGVTVAVLDSGVNGSLSDLQGNMLPGWNAASQNSDTSDIATNSHGTTVAATVAAVTNNANGVASVAFNAKILPVRITNNSSTSAYASDIARGVTWAADQGAQVVNCSYSFIQGSSTVTSAAQYLRGKGGVLVVSAGNTSGDQGFAPNSSMITVSATDSADARWSGSSFGNYVDFAAPGAKIWTMAKTGAFGAATGTSFAAPVTAAVIALMRSVNPQLGPSQLESILQSTSADLGASGWDPYFGFGRVNAAAAVAMAASSSPADSQAPTVALDSPGDGAQVHGIVTITATAGDNYGVSQVELYVNGALVSTDQTDAYSYAWDSTQAGDGTATMMVRAIDEAGNRTDSQTIRVTVANVQDTTAPTVKVTSPSEGASVSTRSVSLSASASDDVAVSTLGLYVDGKLLCTGTTSTACSWNTRKVTAGTSHTITAIAADQAGNKGQHSVTVVVGEATTTSSSSTTDTSTTDSTSTTDTTTSKKGGGKGR